MTGISNGRRLSAVILVMIALSLLISSPVLAAQACPKGKVNCNDPCKQYTDANSNNICDLSESGATNNTGNTSINAPTASNNAADNNNATTNTSESSIESGTADNSGISSNQAGPPDRGRKHGGPPGSDVQNSANQSDTRAASDSTDVQGFFAANMRQNAIPILGGVIALLLVGGVYLGRTKKKG